MNRRSIDTFCGLVHDVDTSRSADGAANAGARLRELGYGG
jgi:hypothetical protein